MLGSNDTTKRVGPLDRQLFYVKIVVIIEGLWEAIFVMLDHWLVGYHRLGLKHLLLNFRTHYL
jgi:hypothetical protein